MNLKSKHKVDPSFNMSSMTDVIFLLLIFFMLTSSFITPSALPVSLPSSKTSPITLQKVVLTVTADKRYFVDEKEVSFVGLKSALKAKLSQDNVDDNVIVVHADKDLKYNDVIEVAGVAAELRAKVSLATKPGN